MDNDYTPLFKKVLLGIGMAAFSLLATFGNTCVLIAMIKEKRLRTVANYFILSLSISDLMIGLFVMPLSASIILFDKWIWGYSTCQGWLTIDYIASTASIFNLFTLTIERFWSIIEPLKYIAHKSKNKANIIIILTWLGSALWFIPINFWNEISNSPNNTSNLIIYESFTMNQSDLIELNYTSSDRLVCQTLFETNKSFKIITTFFNFYVPLIGMILIYSTIFLKIKSRSQSELVNNSKSVSGFSRSNKLNEISYNKYSKTESEDSKYNEQEPQNHNIQEKECNSTYEKMFFKENNSLLINKVFLSRTKKRQLRDSYFKNKPRRNGLNQFHIIKTLPDTANKKKPSHESSKTSETTEKSIEKTMSKLSPGLNQQIKVAKQLGILLLAFLVFWMPYSIVFLVVAFCPDCITSDISIVCVWLGYINSAINPILYPLCNSEFKSAFRKMFRISPSEPTRRDIINILNYNNAK